MVKILVSACLLGRKVRYNGEDLAVADDSFKQMAEHHEMVPFCPEVSGGLPTPRPPAEIRGGDGMDVLSGTARVVCRDGRDATDAFLRGARLALASCSTEHIRYAVLTESSPSCGSNMIYDGTFSNLRHPGRGVTTALLEQNGIRVFSQFRLAEFLDRLKGDTP